MDTFHFLCLLTLAKFSFQCETTIFRRRFSPPIRQMFLENRIVPASPAAFSVASPAPAAASPTATPTPAAITTTASSVTTTAGAVSIAATTVAGMTTTTATTTTTTTTPCLCLNTPAPTLTGNQPQPVPSDVMNCMMSLTCTPMVPNTVAVVSLNNNAQQNLFASNPNVLLMTCNTANTRWQFNGMDIDNASCIPNP